MPEDRPNPLEQLELELTHLRARLKEVEKDLSACREAAFALGERLSAAQERPAVPEGLPVPPAVAPPPPTPSQAQATSDFRAGAVSTPQPEPPSSAQRRLQAFFQSGAPAAPPGPPPWHVAREWLFKIIGRPPEGENIEMLLGIYWLVRLGVLALAIALGMWGVYLSQGSGPVQRVLLGYALSAVLLAAGWYYRRHVELFGRSLIAGGLAIGFFVSFAAHFLPAMNCLPVPASALLSAAFVAAMLAISERWQAPVIAGMSIFIGQAAAYVATREVGAEPLLAMLILAAAALYLQLRRGWTHLSLFALASSYLTLAPWLFTHPGREHNDFHFWLNLTCLTTIYGVFICAQLLFLLRRGEAQKSFLETALGVTVGVVNALFYFVFTSFLYLMTDRVEVLFGFYFPLAAVQVGVGMLERRRDSGADAFYFALAVVLALLGTFSAWDGLARNAILYAFALLLLIAGYRLRMAVFYYAAEGVLAVAVLDFLHYHAVRPFAPNDYWGGLFGAAVLFTKSMLEERQPPPAHWGREWMEFMRRANQVLTWTHAGLAVVLCAWLSHARWDGRAEMIALAILSLVILLAGCRCGRAPPSGRRRP
ncbi:DUF2339 domain-containing protein [bacterium]|nr:DUF2339 domain-containing protein [bacterium]